MKKLSAGGAEMTQGANDSYGTHAARPAATSFAPGMVYWETDTGQAFISDGTVWHGPINPGCQLDYAQITTTSGVINATTEGTANAVITGNSVTYDGTPVKIEFYYFSLDPNASNGVLGSFVFLRDAVVIGQSGAQTFTSTNSPEGLHAAFDTPPAGAHTYAVKAFVPSNSFKVVAGAGGSGNKLPAFLRVTKA